MGSDKEAYSGRGQALSVSVARHAPIWDNPAMPRSVFKSPWLSLSLACLAAACSGPTEQVRYEPETEEEIMWHEIAAECLDIIEIYQATNPETASEAELERQMAEADANRDVCRQAFQEAYHGPGGEVMGRHLSGSLVVHSLQAELALSQRFDEMEGYCAILEELIRSLADDVRELDEYLRDDPSDSDLRHLSPLFDLTVQTLQISMLDYGEACD